jgi:nitroreductase
MDTLQAIHERRSIRRFTSQPVPRDLVKRVLEATVQAPSAKNVQPWRFVVLEGEEKERLVRLMIEKGDALAAAGEGTGSLLGTCRRR